MDDFDVDVFALGREAGGAARTSIRPIVTWMVGSGFGDGVWLGGGIVRR